MSDHNYDRKSPRKTNAYQRMKQLCIVACPINELKLIIKLYAIFDWEFWDFTEYRDVTYF